VKKAVFWLCKYSFFDAWFLLVSFEKIMLSEITFSFQFFFWPFKPLVLFLYLKEDLN